ncbi:MAG: GAF domain-containing protein [Armatimonadetes bacterium]|nr:GAF domain-containing protein [Armatimonadota bacterium]
MRSLLFKRRLRAIQQRSDDPDIQILQAELDSVERQLRESHLLLDQLRAELEEKAGETEALRRIGEATGSAIDLEEMLKVIADVAVQVTGTDSCQVYIYDSTHDELVLRAADPTAQNMVGKIRLKLGEGITGWVARERKHVAVIRQAYADHRFKYFSEIHEDEYESILSVPLVMKQQILGVINVRTRQPREYTKHQVRLLSGIASQVAGAIQQSERRKQLETTAVQLRTLSAVSEAITSNLYLEELLQLFVAVIAQTLGYKICTVMLVNEENQELIIKATQSDSSDYRKKPNPKIGESIAGRAVAEGKVITVLDVKNERDYGFPDVAQKAGLCSMASVPLMVHNRVIGVLNCYTEKPHIFSKEEIAILRAMGTQAALAIEHAKLMVRAAVIQEMHHRVKNNLQQIASLVRLQSHYSQYKTVEEALNDTLKRILAIAAVHELLSRDDLDAVSVRKLAEQILTATKQSVVHPGKTVHSKVEGNDLMLPLSQATRVALVLNELIQNAIEHGFRSLDEGRIHVHIIEDEKEVRLVVINDGEPLPDDFDLTKTNTLGLRIVQDLVCGGLKGRFSLVNGNGIVATVVFPRDANAAD